MNYEQHIRALANELGATIREQKTGSPAADTSSRVLWLSQYDGTTHWYMAALHELGHIADQPEGKGLLEMVMGTTPHVLESEARAWEWALAQSQLPLDVARGDIAFTLGTYTAEMLANFGPAALNAVRGGATSRIAARVGADVDFSDTIRWARGLGLDERMEQAGENAWQLVVSELAGAA